MSDQQILSSYVDIKDSLHKSFQVKESTAS